MQNRRQRSVTLELLQQGQAINSPHDIGLALLRVTPSQVAHSQRLTQHKLRAEEGIARLHLRILAHLCHEMSIAQIASHTDSVGHPSEAQAVAHLKARRGDCLIVEIFRLAGNLPLQSTAEGQPIAPLGIISKPHYARLARFLLFHRVVKPTNTPLILLFPAENSGCLFKRKSNLRSLNFLICAGNILYRNEE